MRSSGTKGPFTLSRDSSGRKADLEGRAELRDVSCVFTEPCLLPSAGGIILACRAAGNEVSEQMIENLRTAQHMRV